MVGRSRAAFRIPRQANELDIEILRLEGRSKIVSVDVALSPAGLDEFLNRFELEKLVAGMRWFQARRHCIRERPHGLGVGLFS